LWQKERQSRTHFKGISLYPKKVRGLIRVPSGIVPSHFKKKNAELRSVLFERFIFYALKSNDSVCPQKTKTWSAPGKGTRHWVKTPLIEFSGYNRKNCLERSREAETASRNNDPKKAIEMSMECSKCY